MGTRLGAVVLRPGNPVKVEMTEHGNLKITNEALETHILLNITNEELNQIAGVVLNIYTKLGVVIDAEVYRG